MRVQYLFRLPGTVDGCSVTVAGKSINLGRRFPEITSGIEIGIRPEFVKIVDTAVAGDAGIPLNVRSVEDIGRYKIVRGEVDGHELGAVISESDNVPASAAVVFDQTRINVYQDSHLVRGQI